MFWSCVFHVLAFAPFYYYWCFIAASKSHGSIFRLSPLTIHGTVLCFHLDLLLTFSGSQLQVLKSSPLSGYNNSFSTPIMLRFITPPSFCCPPKPWYDPLFCRQTVRIGQPHTRCIRSTAYGCLECSRWHPSRQLCTNWVLSLSSECTWAHNSLLWHET